MTYVLGQHSAAAQGTHQSQAYASNITAGDLLVVFSGVYNSVAALVTLISNTGTAGVQTWNSFGSLFRASGQGVTMQGWWAIASGSGSCTVTVEWDTSGELYVAEWSGTSVGSLAQDGSMQTADSFGASITIPPITTTAADDLVLGYAICDGGPTVNSPWTQVDTVSGHPWFYRADLPPATYTPDISQTAGTFACIMAALGPPGAPAAIPLPDYPPTHFGPF